MAFEFKLPDIGEGVHEGEISKWLVKKGDSIREDQPMVEVMTDKVTVEITSPVSGTVQSQLYKEGDTVKVGAVIITIEEAGAKTAKKPAAVAHAENGGLAPKPSLPQEAPMPAVSKGGALAPALSGGPGGKALAAPAVRKLARSMGINLALVSGSGPHGRIRKDDILTFAPEKAAAMMPSGAARPTLALATPEERIPFRGMRRKIAEHLVKSKQTAPHFTYVEEADMTVIVELRNELQAYAEPMGVKLTFLPFIVKAVVEGLKKYPVLNSSLDEASQEIVLKHYVNMGIAVATDDGLIVPVVKNAQDKSILELAQEIADLGNRARAGKLAITDLQGGTFTLTSIGSIGGVFSAPIINIPEVAIMGIQKIAKRPVVKDDAIVIREMTYFSISCDHRVVDGAEAALFMKEVIGHLEHPGRLLLNAR